MTIRAAILAAAAATAAACGGSTSQPTGMVGAPSPVAASSVTAHFTFTYDARDASTIPSYVEAVEREYPRIVADLGIGSMPLVSIHLYRDHAALEAAVAPVVGAIPSWATGLATAVDQIHAVTTIGATNLVHEFAHCGSIRINPGIPNHPRWLWETVAIYEAGQSVNPRTLPYMVAGSPPAFATLNGFDNTLIYDVGYTIGEFIVARGGLPALAALVASGDVQTTLGVTLPEFERAWLAFVRDRYGL